MTENFGYRPVGEGEDADASRGSIADGLSEISREANRAKGYQNWDSLLLKVESRVEFVK